MISSVNNSQVKNVVSLCRKPAERDSQGLFVVEGIKMFREVPRSHLQTVYLTESFYQKYHADPDLAPILDSGCAQMVSDECMERMADTKTPQGVVCLVRQFHWELPDLLAGEDHRKPLVMVLENVQDPGNLGTILRAGEAAGATGILLTKGSADMYNPKVTRSTMGSIFRVPFAYTDSPQQVLGAWKREGLRLCAAHLEGRVSYDHEDYTQPAAFLIGNESRGLTRAMADLADSCIRIPMAGKVESLNAAVAASILMFEAARQRRQRLSFTGRPQAQAIL